MYISVKSIFNSPVFDSMEILAGSNGMHRNVKRVSILDLKPAVSSIIRLREGDLFLTCFAQFSPGEEDEVISYISDLVDAKCAGLIICTEEHLDVVSEQVRDFCNNNDFPLLCLTEDQPYIYTIDVINQYIFVNTLNISKNHRIQQIMSGEWSGQEPVDILNSIAPMIKEYLIVICFEGECDSDLGFANFHVNVLNKPGDFFCEDGNLKRYIVSAPTEKKLWSSLSAVKESIMGYYNIIAWGESQVYEKRNIRRALVESEDSLKLAHKMPDHCFIAEPLSTWPIIMHSHDSYYAHAFYNAFCSVIESNCSSEYKRDMLDTIRIYVECQGNYKWAANTSNQHENTIRYRISSLKKWLGMEDETIRFHEVISLAAKLEKIYKTSG
ncbi:MAG: PucR family transcriptional regulator ligand-binding domain-containing protein [Bacillota bacterium]|nr:PucR family transcriptional regulator ligand-binding domain-containing protein [Bacillota bacterium]